MNPFGFQKRKSNSNFPVLQNFQVLLTAFGATLAWIPLLKPNSFVIEMHPGPPEALTCLVVSAVGQNTFSDGKKPKNGWLLPTRFLFSFCFSDFFMCFVKLIADSFFLLQDECT